MGGWRGGVIPCVCILIGLPLSVGLAHTNQIVSSPSAPFSFILLVNSDSSINRQVANFSRETYKAVMRLNNNNNIHNSGKATRQSKNSRGPKSTAATESVSK